MAKKSTMSEPLRTIHASVAYTFTTGGHSFAQNCKLQSLFESSQGRHQSCADLSTPTLTYEISWLACLASSQTR